MPDGSDVMPICERCGGQGHMGMYEDRDPPTGPDTECPDCGGTGHISDVTSETERDRDSAVAGWGEAERQRQELQAEVERLHAQLIDAHDSGYAQGVRHTKAEVERLREALREYGDHQSWRCEHAPHFYLADPADAKAITDRGDCFCGLDATLRDLGLLDITALPPGSR